MYGCRILHNISQAQWPKPSRHALLLRTVASGSSRSAKTFCMLPRHSLTVLLLFMLCHARLQKGAKLHYGNPAEFTLTVPEFEVKPGEVVAVVGRVGSGEYDELTRDYKAFLGCCDST